MQVTLCFLFACCKMTSNIAIYFNDLTHLTETDESLTTAICSVIMTILAADESKKQVTEFLNAFLNNKDEIKTPSYCKSFLLEILKDFFGTRYMLARALEDKSFEKLDKGINAILRVHYQDRNVIYRPKCFRVIVVLFVDGISLDYKLKKKFIVCYYEINNATILQEQSKLLAGSEIKPNRDLHASKVIYATQNMKTTLSAKEVFINFCQKQFDFEFLIMTMNQVKRKIDLRKLSNTSMADKKTTNGGLPNVDDNLQSNLGTIVIIINLTPLIINYLQFLNKYLQAGSISDPEKLSDIENETVYIFYHELTLSYHNLSKNIKQKYIDLVHLFGFKLSFYWIGDIEDIAYSGSFQSNRTNAETLDLIENKLTNFIGKFLCCSENDLTLKMILLANKQQAEDQKPVYLCIVPNRTHSF